MNTLRERIIWARTNKSERDGKEFTQQDLATKAGVTQGNIAHLESGRTKTSRSLTKIASALEVNPEWLADGKGEPFKAISNQPLNDTAHLPGARRVVFASDDDEEFVQIQKVKLRLNAGVTGIETEPDYGDGRTISVPQRWVIKNSFSLERLVAIRIRGESMEPSLYEDDTVIINTADKAPVDGVVFAVNYEGEAVVKRLSRDAGDWWLMSDNADQRKFHRKICRGENCIIVGRVVRKESDRI